MRKITEVLRLRAQGRSMRQIAASVGVGHSTVGEYLHRAESAGLAWPLPEGLGEEELDAALFPPPLAVEGERPVPDWRAVHAELKAKKGVTRRLLWLEWREAHPEGWGYSQFCWHYDQWLGCQDVVMRLTYAGGEAMFVDFSGDRATWVDPGTGEAHVAEVGLMSLARRYSPERLDAACARALGSGAISYSSVKSILAEGLDRVPLRTPEDLPAPPSHANLRGPSYWADADADGDADAGEVEPAAEGAASEVSAGAGA